MTAIAPALRAMRTQPARWTGQTRSMVGPGQPRVRAALIALQVALSAILLVGTGLSIRSMARVTSVEPGLDVERLLVASVDLDGSGYGTAESEAVYEAVMDRLSKVPGVQSVAMTPFALLGGISYESDVVVVGGPASAARAGDLEALVNAVGAAYFRTTGTDVLRGREFEERDREAGQALVVVNGTLARQMAPNGDAVGLCLAVPPRLTIDACGRVIGVVDDHRHRYLEADVPPTLYLSHARMHATFSGRAPHVVIRTAPDPSTLIPEVRAAFQEVRPDLPFVTIEPLSERIGPVLLPFRLGAILFPLFGLLAVAIAGLGLYGVISYLISERAPELGLRRSLGATKGEIVRLVVLGSVAPVAVGTLAGLAVAYAGGRMIEALLFETSGRDPVTLAAAAAFLLSVALMASYLPARRGASVDPMVALRAQ